MLRYLVGTDATVADVDVADTAIVDAVGEDADLEDVFVSVPVPSQAAPESRRNGR